MASTTLRIGAFQFAPVRGDVAANAAAVERALDEAEAADLDLVVLPEMWPTSFLDGGGPVGDERSFEAAVQESDRALERVRAWTSGRRTAVAGSAYGPVGEGGRRTNRLTVFERGTARLAIDKVHLFTPTAEPVGFAAGDALPRAAELAVGRAAGLVCYDLRFPGLVDALAADPPDVLVVPAQWPAERVDAWRALLVARAVELQCFVVGANRTGRDRIGRRGLELAFPGSSLVASPEGRVVALGGAEPALVWAEVERSTLSGVRRAVPVSRDRRAGFDREGPDGK